MRISKVKISENGKKAIFLNPERKPVVKTRVDGCLCVNVTACDWLVRSEDNETVLVELKGTDVDHAIKQIEETFQFLKTSERLGTKSGALIVCSRPFRHPSFTTKLQRARARLSATYRAPLHIVTGDREFHISRVVEHGGPY